jgi:hypothetical protein
MIDWNKILSDAIKVAEQVVSGQWPRIAKSTTNQIAALVENAKSIETDKADMTSLEYKAIKLTQQRALEGVIAGTEAMSIVVAEQVAAAVWGVVEGALKTIPELAPFIP